MQKSVIFIIFLSVFYACNSAGSTDEQTKDTEISETQVSQDVNESPSVPDTADAAIFQWEEETYSFGEIKEGETVEHTYSFTNTGKSPLIISDVQASCGCTTPEFTTEPVKPGEKGSVKVLFDSQGQRGKQQKVISILSNAHPRVSVLHLKGEVKE